ncbi:MAG: hypothetical protein COU28_01165 [Candidatus Magasanikbacteria bacterium CG10_big_fil_rev_8_21_14_0_10_36_16]|uniref:Uncharacterized protein n=1 Tax=Candidatus Magasanikbacteria bacterium CG10_big_fil_rev_8_21_14_0_10_36_16 TaxID=1974645 RepID=A0A2H0TZ61_9BACT|nr:MAG: hypothetical protein COU28_01165 [Candidatus Magasanikbacteria bacterium CG10_big_fil_rev_8_21_14_0_10_36_16]
MPVKNKIPKKNKKKKIVDISQVEKEQTVVQDESIKNIEKDIKENIEILEHKTPVTSEEHVFVKKDLPVEVEGKVEVEEKNDGTPSEKDMKSKENNISQKLTEIYENDNGDIPDMRLFQKSSHSRFLWAFFVLIFSVIFFAAIAWVGFFVIQPNTKFSEDNIILTISGNENFRSGENSTYRIRYKNPQDVALHNVVLEVRYPKGFVFASSTKSTVDDNHDSWNLGDLEAEGSGYIDIVGNIYGDISSEQSFRVFLNYVPENFSSSFQKVTSLTLTSTDTLVKIEVQVADQVVAGLDTPVKIIVSPASDVPVKNISVSCDSSSFTFKSSEPKTVPGKDCQWNFDSLDAPQEINVFGFFTEDKDNGNKFSVAVKNWVSSERTGDGYILANVEKDVVLSKLDTLYSLVVNGTTGSFDMQPGDTISASIFIKNNGESVLKDAKLKFIIDAPANNNRSILNWTSLDTGDIDGDIVGQKISDDVRRGIITWDKRYIAGLKNIMPGDEVKVNITLLIKNANDLTLSDYAAFMMNISSELSYTLNDKTETISSNKLDIKLTSDLKMTAKDDVSQDVGGDTVHKISWLLTNSYHDLKNLEISADLYGDISLDESNIVVPAGTITYDKDQKKLLWKIDQMPISVDILAAQFEIKVLSDNPTQKNLTSKPVIKAFDDILQQDIQVFGQEVLLGEVGN